MPIALPPSSSHRTSSIGSPVSGITPIGDRVADAAALGEPVLVRRVRVERRVGDRAVDRRVLLPDLDDQLAGVLGGAAQPKRPLQCVTVKMPLPAYLRMKRAAQKWNLTYTDVINFCTQRVVPILETPSGQVVEMLEQHRMEGENKKEGAAFIPEDYV